MHVSPRLFVSTTISEQCWKLKLQRKTWRFLVFLVLRKQLANFWSTSPDDQQLGVHESAAVLKPSSFRMKLPTFPISPTSPVPP